jgi:hypothetical protein
MCTTTSATSAGWRDASLDEARDEPPDGSRDRQETPAASMLQTPTRNTIVGFMDRL